MSVKTVLAARGLKSDRPALFSNH